MSNEDARVTAPAKRRARPKSVTLAPGAVIGQLEIKSELGRGGMGVVFLARDLDLDRDVAVKVINPSEFGSSKTESQRLLREARAMAKVSDENVVRVHQVGTHQEELFIVMELVVGMSLREWLSQPRQPREIVRVFGKAGRGLAAIHRAGLVHRDFKPANVLLADDGRVCVADFGAVSARAEIEVSGLPESSIYAGTPRYMAPEQFRQQDTTPATDIYAFSVALYEALVGRHPIQFELPRELADKTIAGEIERDFKLPRRLKAAILAGLATEPGDRLSMEEMLDALSPRRRWRGAALLAGAIGAAALGLTVASSRVPIAIDVDIGAAANSRGIAAHEALVGGDLGDAYKLANEAVALGGTSALGRLLDGQTRRRRCASDLTVDGEIINSWLLGEIAIVETDRERLHRVRADSCESLPSITLEGPVREVSPSGRLAIERSQVWDVVAAQVVFRSDSSLFFGAEDAVFGTDADGLVAFSVAGQKRLITELPLSSMSRLSGDGTVLARIEVDASGPVLAAVSLASGRSILRTKLTAAPQRIALNETGDVIAVQLGTSVQTLRADGSSSTTNIDASGRELDLSSRGDLLFVRSDKTLTSYDLRRSMRVAQIDLGEFHHLDHRRAVVGTVSGPVLRWLDAATGAEIDRLVLSHPIDSFAVSGESILTVANEELVTWRARHVRELFVADGGEAVSGVLSAGDRVIVETSKRAVVLNLEGDLVFEARGRLTRSSTSSGDTAVIRGELVDLRNGSVLWTAPKGTSRVELSKDGKVVVYVNGDGAFVKRVSSEKPIELALPCAGPECIPVARHSPGSVVVTTPDRSMSAFEPHSGELRWRIALPVFAYRFVALASGDWLVLADGRALLVSGRDGSIREQASGPANRIAAFGDAVVLSQFNPQLKTLPLELEPVEGLDGVSALSGPAREVSFTSDGKTVDVVAHSGDLFRFDAQTGALRDRTLAGNAASVVLLPDRRLIAARSHVISVSQ